MKKFFFSVGVAIAAMVGTSVYAQDDPFNFDEASNFNLIYLDANIADEWEIASRIDQDLRVNDNTVYLYNWISDGSKYVSNAQGKGFFGQIAGFLGWTVEYAAGGWSGAAFCAVESGGKQVDFTKITDDYHFHMAAKSSTAGRAHNIQVAGMKDAAAKFSIGVGEQDAAPNITPDFTTDGTWHVIDLPISRLRELGWENRAPFYGNFFTMLSGNGPSDLGIDAVFYYKPKSENSVGKVGADALKVIVTNQIVEVLNATEPIEVYNVSGIKVKTSEKSIFGVDELEKGIYMIKCGNAIAKVAIK